MTTQVRALPTQAQHQESHDPAAECWLCAEGPQWWAELRRKHGLSSPPYDRPRVLEPVVERLVKERAINCPPKRKQHEWVHLSAFVRRCCRCGKQERTRYPWA